MYKIDRIETSVRTFTLQLLVTAIFIILSITGSNSQQNSPLRSLKIDSVSTEIVKFDTAITRGPGKRAITYQEALVLSLIVDKEEYDNLPPSIEPFLYIGQYEYRIFNVNPSKTRDNLVLTFHILDWDKLKDNSTIILTIDHGGPIRDVKKFLDENPPRFLRRMVIDKRE